MKYFELSFSNLLHILETVYMIDIHAHILPEIDDGSQDLEDSLLMAELAAESGVKTIVATPHCNIPGRYKNYRSEELISKFTEFQNAVKNRNIPVQIITGMEIYATNDIALKIKKSMVIPINNSRYYLMEFGFYEEAEWMTKILDSVLELDVIPVIAHPERYEVVQQHTDYVKKWKGMGCLLQANKGSFFGRFGRNSMNTVLELLEEGIITCVASDAHSPYRRTTYMGDIEEFLCEEFSEALAEELLLKNPKKIIENKTI